MEVGGGAATSISLFDPQAEEVPGLGVDGLQHVSAGDVDAVDVARGGVAGPEGEPVRVEGDGEELSGAAREVAHEYVPMTLPLGSSMMSDSESATSTSPFGRICNSNASSPVKDATLNVDSCVFVHLLYR